MRGLIRQAAGIGLKPHEVREMTPGDLSLFFKGWIEAHTPPKPGSNAPSRDEYEALKRRFDGGNNSI